MTQIKDETAALCILILPKDRFGGKMMRDDSVVQRRALTGQRLYRHVAMDQGMDGFGLAAEDAKLALTQEVAKRKHFTSYGTCGSCGATIPEERMEALPFTPYCRTCVLL